MLHKLKILFFSLSFVLALLLLFFYRPISSYLYYSLYNKDNLKINISVVNTKIHTICAEASNQVFLKADVKDLKGLPMSNAPVEMQIEEGSGELSTERGLTDSSGQLIFSYTPKNYYELNSKTGNHTVRLIAQIKDSNESSSIEFSLTSTPIIMIHGYQENAQMFDNLNDYLSSKNFYSSSMGYDSTIGVIAAANELEKYLNQKKVEYLNKGILVNKFTLITHSMGGLLARYYTTSEKYINNNDVNKIIFLSVPHNGSYIASIGENYFNDESIKDLIPDSQLFTNVFENSINSGLNHSIQAANILSQYDEVVTAESASLDQWRLSTEIFNVGENNFTVNNILSGDIMNAPNHKGIMNNKKVFDRINEMLNMDLPYPAEVQK